MYTIALGRWSHAAGKWFVRTRVYLKGYIWTPFCKINWRYK